MVESKADLLRVERWRCTDINEVEAFPIDSLLDRRVAIGKGKAPDACVPSLRADIDDRNDLEIGLPFVSVRMTLTDHAVSNECAAEQCPSSDHPPGVGRCPPGASRVRSKSGDLSTTLVSGEFSGERGSERSRLHLTMRVLPSHPCMDDRRTHGRFRRSDEVMASAVAVDARAATRGDILPSTANGTTVYPRFMTRAEGPFVWDVDGNRFTDFLLGYGPVVLGHAQPDVMAAAVAQLSTGNCIAALEPAAGRARPPADRDAPGSGERPALEDGLRRDVGCDSTGAGVHRTRSGASLWLSRVARLGG